VAAEAIATLERLQPEVASELRVLEFLWKNEPARFVLQLEKHNETYPDSRAFAYSLAEAYGLIGELDKVRALSPRTGMIIAAQQGQEGIALTMMDELAAAETDPHDRADVYWMGYCALGRYDDALKVLSDLWYGYAEEHMGPRMDGFDVDVFGMLLAHAGRRTEAERITELIRTEELSRGVHKPSSRLLIGEGRLDEAMTQLQESTGRGEFYYMGIKPYFCYAGLDAHPDYPSLVAKFDAWRVKQSGLYQSLKAEE
ncbi:MAG TPA: hypothetical protein VLB07_02050, partial [Woeseiaceae bacterium]|nr:hypothetical protein [Woeseiaceae bacterium]